MFQFPWLKWVKKESKMWIKGEGLDVLPDIVALGSLIIISWAISPASFYWKDPFYQLSFFSSVLPVWPTSFEISDFFSVKKRGQITCTVIVLLSPTLCTLREIQSFSDCFWSISVYFNWVLQWRWIRKYILFKYTLMTNTFDTKIKLHNHIFYGGDSSQLYWSYVFKTYFLIEHHC